MFKNFAIKLLATSVLLGFCSFSSAFAQTVKGKVTDSSNQPLPGVSVFFKGTTIGVSTDIKGNYSISSKEDAKTLVFSCIGMKEQEISINKRAVINVVMQDESTFLEEAVAIGYSTVQRKDLLGSVASASNKDVMQVPVLNFSEALAGKMAGVDVRVAEGDPDSPVEIKVRGAGSITQDSSPLYIVDGFPVASISDIAPSEIKSIDVLKDAFSTAIYGSRGAYGVVLITTKDGASGRVTVSYDNYFGVKKMANMDAVEVMSPYEYARYSYESAVLSDASTPTGHAASSYEPHFGSFADMEQYKNFKGNDWKKLIFGQTGFTMNHNVSVSGNSDKTRWTASYSNLKEDAIMMNSSYLRHNIAVKASTTPVKALTFNVSTRWSSTLITGAGANSINDKGNNGGNGRMANALRYSPIPMDYFQDMEDYDVYVEGFGANPVRDIKDNDDRRTRETWNLSGSATWTIIPNLKLKGELGMDSNKSVQNRFYGLSSYYVRSKATILNQPCLESFNITDKAYRANAVLTYNFNNVLSKKHKLDLLLGGEYLNKQQNKETILAEGYPKTFTAERARVSRGTAEDIISANNMFYEDDTMISAFARGNYSFDNRYSVSAAIRADGSSKFSKNNRWGIFPSAAASWNIANESFLKDVKAVNQLKLRYSFGAAGNNRIPSGNIRLQYTTSQDPRIDGVTNVMTPSSVMPNPDLKWEKTLSHNVGVDFAFFKTRISGSLEAYHNTTNDLLINFPVSGAGYSTQYRNIGSVLNKGLEATLRFVLVEKRNFGLSLSGNIALNKNVVLNLGGVEEIRSESKWASSGVGSDFIVREGDPLGMVYGYLSDGYYGIDDFNYSINSEGVLSWKLKDDVPIAPKASIQSTRPGTPKFKDVNNDGTIDDKDKVAIGHTLPLGTGGFALNMNCYGFDLTANFNFSFGNDVYNAQSADLSMKGNQSHKNLLKKFNPGSAFTCIDWETGEQITDIETLREVNANAKWWSPATAMYFVSDSFIEDGSFLRCSSVTIGYTLPQALTGRIHIKKLRIFCTGNNLFCLTNYSGFDPEVNCRRSTPLTPGVDYSAYPKSRGIIGGINITF